MSNPFYPPKQTHSDGASRGSIGAGADSQPIAFDPDRRAGNLARFHPNGSTPAPNGAHDSHQREGTEGPGGASLFYSHDAPLDGDMPVFGTGTDGFGGALQTPRRAQVYEAPDYRHEYMQQGGGEGGRGYNGQLRPGEPFRPQYHTPVYEQSPQARTMLLAEDGRGVGLGERAAYSQEQLHQYPPQPSLSPLHSFSGSPSRPSTPGFYPDRAPKLDKLTDEQKKIVKDFPADLDEENGSLWKTAVAMAKDWRSFVKWKYAHYYILLVIVILLVALMTIYHHQIINWLTPVSQKVRSVSWGWVIPVVILFVISFPPLFGHEIVGILLGVVYGLWVGFGILSLGTLLGEWGNFYAFRFFLQKHGERYERKSLNYACMAYIVREGGFLVILLARLSAIPGHFTTAVFATVGMGFFVFTLATLLSMPKQLLVVYLGVVLEQSGAGNESTQSKVIKYVVLIVSTLVTLGVAVYLYGKMQKARPTVQARLRERRFVLLTEAGGAQTRSSEEGVGGIPEEETGKLYGQGEAGLYSTDDLDDSTAGKKKVKGASRWKWGKKSKKEAGLPAHIESMESLEKAADGGAKLGRASFDTDSWAHAGPGDVTLTAQYPKSRPEHPFPAQHQQQYFHQDEQDRYYYPQSAPVLASGPPMPYATMEQGQYAMSTAPPGRNGNYTANDGGYPSWGR